MAEGKKAFTAYCDWHETFKELTDEEAGKLAKHLFSYVNDEEPETPDRLTQLLFKPIMLTLKRDLQKYLKVIGRNRSNGQKGGRPKNPEKPSGLIDNPKEPVKDKDKDKDKDTVKVKDTVTDIVKVKGIEEGKGGLQLRKTNFGKILAPFNSEIEKSDLVEFYEYWTEHGINDRKMRFEKEKSFDVSRRLKTWMRRKIEFASEKKRDTRIHVDEAIENIKSGKTKQKTEWEWNNPKQINQ